MREVWVVFGIVLLLVGAYFLLVSVVPAGGESVTVSLFSGGGNVHQVSENISGFSITGSLSVYVSWASNLQVSFEAASCSDECSFSNLPYEMVAGGEGTTGSSTFNQPNGGNILLVWSQENFSRPSYNLTYSVWTTVPNVGPCLLISGAIVLFVGIALPPRSEVLVDSVAPEARAGEYGRFR
jgi:hypothetical protein